MPKAIAKLPDDFYKKIAKLETNTEKVLEKALHAGADVMETQVKSNLKDAIGKDIKYPQRITNQLVNAIGSAPVKVDYKGIHNTKVGFNEPRKAKGKSTTVNAKIANVLEYGKGARGKGKGEGQYPTPFLKPAIRTHKKKCITAITETLDDEFKKVLK